MLLQLFYSGANVDMLKIPLRTGAKAAAGGGRNRDEKGIALVVLNNSRDSGAARRLRSRARRMLRTASWPSRTPDPEIGAWVTAARVISSATLLCVLRSKY